jgi:hypothetical protein
MPRSGGVRGVGGACFARSASVNLLGMDAAGWTISVIAILIAGAIAWYALERRR